MAIWGAAANRKGHPIVTIGHFVKFSPNASQKLAIYVFGNKKKIYARCQDSCSELSMFFFLDYTLISKTSSCFFFFFGNIEPTFVAGRENTRTAIHAPYCARYKIRAQGGLTNCTHGGT